MYVCALSQIAYTWSPTRKPQSLGVQNLILQQAVSSCARGQTFDLLGEWRGCAEKAKTA